jgi:hypothetical protein
LPCYQIDGTWYEDLYTTVRPLIQKMRQGGGPVLVEALVVRLEVAEGPILGERFVRACEKAVEGRLDQSARRSRSHRRRRNDQARRDDENGKCATHGSGDCKSSAGLLPRNPQQMCRRACGSNTVLPDRSSKLPTQGGAAVLPLTVQRLLRWDGAAVLTPPGAHPRCSLSDGCWCTPADAGWCSVADAVGAASLTRVGAGALTLLVQLRARVGELHVVGARGRTVHRGVAGV